MPLIVKKLLKALDTGPRTLSHTLNTGIFWGIFEKSQKIQILFNLLNDLTQCIEKKELCDAFYLN